MGGFGSGRHGGRATVESALKLDVDAMIRARVIQPGAHVGGEMKFQFDDDELATQFEALTGDPADSWIRLRYTISDYWTGKTRNRRQNLPCRVAAVVRRPAVVVPSAQPKTGVCASSIC